MTILLMPTGTDGGAPTGTGNNARISLVIDAPDQKQFGGIDAAASRLLVLKDQLEATNKAMGDLGFKKFDTKSFTDLNKAVDDGINKIQASADAIAKQTQAATSAAQSQTKLTESTVKLQQATAGSMQSSQLNEQGIWKTTRAMDEWGKSTLKSVNEGEKWTQSNRMQATALAKVTTAITESVTAAKTKTAESLKLENEPARLLEQAKAWRDVAKSTRMAVDADGGQLSRPQRASFALKEAEAQLNAAKLESKAQAVRRAEIEKTFKADDRASKQQTAEESALRTQLDAAAKHQIESSKLVRDAQIEDAKAVAKQRKALLGKDQKEDRAHHEVVAAKTKVEAASTHEEKVRSSATSMSQFAGVDMLAINKALGEASNAKKKAQGELADAERRMFDATEARQQAGIKATTAAQKAAEDDAYKRNVEETRRKIATETAAVEASAKAAVKAQADAQKNTNANAAAGVKDLHARTQVATSDDARKRIFEEERAAKDAADRTKLLVEEGKARVAAEAATSAAAARKSKEQAKGFAAIEKGQAAAAPPESERGIVGGTVSSREATKQAQERLRNWKSQVSEAGKHELDVAKRTLQEKLNFANLLAEDEKKKFGPGQKDELAKLELDREKQKLAALKEYQTTANRLLGQAETARIKQKPFRSASNQAAGLVEKGETSVAAYEAHVQSATQARIAVDNNAMRERIKSDAALRLKKDLADAENFKQQRLSQRTASPNQHTEKAERQRIEAAYEGRKGVAYRRAEQSTTAVDPQMAAGHALNASKAYTGMAGALHHATVASDKFNDSTHLIGKNMLQNIAHVTAWSASVGVLYGSLRVLKESVGSVIEMQYQQARLGVVLRSGQSDATELTDTILKLASANGRGAQEAMQAAVQWARLGMTKEQVAKATAVSLEAANVAEISAADATERLSSIMINFHLNVNQLNGVLGMLNNTSNKYNVTVGSLLDGIARVASVAQQAGISFAELQAIIGSTVGATGQTGPNIGNSLKSLIGSITDKETQKKLREAFEIETTSGGEMKDMTRIINDMYVAYMNMTKAEQKSMIFSTVGKQQASRVTAMLDNYVHSQVLAVNALTNLNSAGAENAVILATVKSQLQGVITEWTRFVSLQAGNAGSVISGGGKLVSKNSSPAGEVLKSIHNIGKIANIEYLSPLMTVLIGLTVAFTARMALASITMQKTAGNSNILSNSFQALKAMIGSCADRVADYSNKSAANNNVTRAMAVANAEAASSTNLLTVSLIRVRQALMLLGGAARMAFASLAVMAGGFAIIGAVAWAFNKVVDVASEKLGHNTDKVLESGDAITETSEKYNRAAEAYSVMARLFQTGIDSITGADSKQAEHGAIQNLLDGLVGIDATLPGTMQKLRAAGMDATKVVAILEQAKGSSLAMQFDAEAVALDHANKKIKIYADQLESLRKSRPLMMSDEDYGKTMDSLIQRIAETRQSLFKTVQTNANDQKRARDEQFNMSVTGLEFLDRQKITLTEINELYKEMGKNADRGMQLDLEAQKLRIIADLGQQQIDVLRAKKKEIAGQTAANPDVYESKVKKIHDEFDPEIEKRKDLISDPQTNRFHIDILEKEIASITAKRNAQLKAIDADREAIIAKTQLGQLSVGIEKTVAEQAPKEAAARAAEAQRESMRKLDLLGNRRAAGSEMMHARIGASAVGEDEYDKMMAKQAMLQSEKSRYDAIQNKTDDDHIRAKEVVAALGQTDLQIQLKRIELEGKLNQHIADRTKEYRRQLMLMGPGDLLASLALKKLAPGMTGGGFLSAAPNMRKLFMDMPGNDFESRDMRATLGKFNALGEKSPEDIAKKQEGARSQWDEIIKGLAPASREALAGLPKEMATLLSTVKTEVMNVNAANVVVNLRPGDNQPVPRISPADPVFPFGGARASGGPVQRNRMYLTGEDGPEMFVPTQDGTIIPNKRTPDPFFDKEVMDAIKQTTSYNKSATNWLVNADSDSMDSFKDRLGVLTNVPGLLTIHGHGADDKQGIKTSSWIFKGKNPLDVVNARDRYSPSKNFQGFSIEEVAQSIGQQTNAVKKVFLTACYRAGYSIADIKKHFPNADQIIAATTGLKPASAKEVNVALGDKKPWWLGMARTMVNGYAEAEPYSQFSNSSTNSIGQSQDWMSKDEIDFAKKLRDGSVEARASGGPVLKDKTYLVGEKGPETFVPKQDGQILAAGSLAGAAARAGFMQQANETVSRIGTRFQVSGITDRSREIFGRMGQGFSDYIRNGRNLIPQSHVARVGLHQAGGRMSSIGGMAGYGPGAVGSLASMGVGALDAMSSLKDHSVDNDFVTDRINSMRRRHEKGSDSIAGRLGISEPNVGSEVPNSIYARGWSNNVTRDPGVDDLPMDSPSSMWDKRPNDFSNEGPSYYQSQWRKEGKDWNTGQNGDNIPFDPKGSGSLLANPNASRNARHMPRQSESDDIEGEEHGKLGYRQNMNRQSRAYRPTQTIRPYAIVPQPGRQTGRPQQAAAAPRIPVAGNNAPVGGDAPAQGQGGAFPAVMAAASAAVATFSGAISAAAANVTLFSTALTAAMANMGPKTAFSGAPNNADNPFS